MLELIGEDTQREGLLKTPERVARAILDTTAGYNEDPEAILRAAMFKEDYSQMVIVKDIDFYSLCEHHILPFFGKVHVAYIPNGYITGLSKIARVVEVFSRRLQVQERMTAIAQVRILLVSFIIKCSFRFFGRRCSCLSFRCSILYHIPLCFASTLPH